MSGKSGSDRIMWLCVGGNMVKVLLVVHLLITIGMVGVILLQRSEGGVLGIGGSGGFMSGRAAGNLLTRATTILAAIFFATSIFLAILANNRTAAPSLMDAVEGQGQPPAPLMDLTPNIPGSVPAEQAPPATSAPATPPAAAPTTTPEAPKVP